VAQQIGAQENPFVDFQYVEATEVELFEEKYDE
jgi:hypothetical protein